MATLRPVSLVGLLALASPAFAQRADGVADAAPVIETTQVDRFDLVFRSVTELHGGAAALEGRLDRAESDLALVAGTSETSSLRTSLQALAQLAAGQAHVALQDGAPRLVANASASAEIVSALEAANVAIAEIAKVSTEAEALSAQGKGLVDTARAVPNQVNPAVLKEAGLKAQQLPKVSRAVNKNVKVVVSTSEDVDAVKARAEALLDEVSSFGSVEPAEAPVATASVGAAAPADLPAPEAAPGTTVAEATPPTEPSPEVPGLTEVAASEPATNELRPQIDRAWAAYLDAETDEAASILAFARQSLATTTTPVANRDLVELYQLSAAVQLSLGEDLGASRDIRRAAGANPLAAPSNDLGPDVRALFDRWSGAASRDLVKVTATQRAWVDGTEVTGDKGITIPAGEHLVQRETDGKVVAEIAVLKKDTVLGGEAAVAKAKGGGPDVSSTAKVERKGGGPNAPMLIAGSAGLAGGAAALVIAVQAERTFHGLSYDAYSYGGCVQGEACYETAREEVILSDAARIRAIYIAGYGLLAVGAGLSTTAFFVAPGPIEPGAWGVHLDARF